MELLGVGYQTIHDADFVMSRSNGYAQYLLLVMKTESFHELARERKLVPRDSIIIYDKVTRQHYGATQKEYIDDWVRFSMSEKEQNMLEKLNIPLNTIISTKSSEQISALIRNISFEFYSANQNREKSCALYLQILFQKINEMIVSKQKESVHPFYPQFVDLRTDIYNKPALAWKVDSMAKSLNLSTSYFQHMYKKLFGISAINDVINSRIAHSKVLLSGTSLSTKKIAELCGYEYDVYFMRQFKEKTGITPKEYRKCDILFQRKV